jgi:galactarate dehydratase
MKEMSAPLVIKVKDKDNVAIAVHDLPAGTTVMPGVTALQPIPQAHKIALVDIPKGGEIIRYGVVLGYAKDAIPCGSWINEHMLDLPESPSVENMPYGTHVVSMDELPDPPRTTWMGYRNAKGPAGTRNILGIVTTVQCAAGVVNVAVQKIKQELLPKYPHVDDVVAVTHPYGCGVAINAPLAKIPIRAVRNWIRHPNFGGEIMLVGLGCEKLTYERLLEPEEINSRNCLTLQDYHGHDAMMKAIMDMAESKLRKLEQRRREELPLSELIVGMQCGGSDAFSGLTANPSAGYAADMLVKGGATVMFSEVTEVRDGVHMLAARCKEKAVRDKLAAEMKWYDDYLAEGGVDRDANPTPGNKKGGLANIVEKAMGSIAKSGTSPIVEVLSPAERPTRHGLIYAATPASDIVCGPCQLASGIGLQVFMTGRGTPYGLAMAPVIKVCSRNEMKEKWFDLIDISAGGVATGEKTIPEVGEEIFNFILDVASGTKVPYSDLYGFHNDLCIFNPAPIT